MQIYVRAIASDVTWLLNHDIEFFLVSVQLIVGMKADDIARKSIMDPAVGKEWSGESIKTLMEICIRCLHNEPSERPSVEDVLWNLQFAAQVQDSWRGEPQSNLQSPDLSSQ